MNKLQQIYQTSLLHYQYEPNIASEKHKTTVRIAQYLMIPARRVFGGKFYTAIKIDPNAPPSLHTEKGLPLFLRALGSILTLPFFVLGSGLMATCASDNFSLIKARIFFNEYASQSLEEKKAQLNNRWGQLSSQDRRSFLRMILTDLILTKSTPEEVETTKALLETFRTLVNNEETFYIDFISQMKELTKNERSQSLSIDAFCRLLEDTPPPASFSSHSKNEILKILKTPNSYLSVQDYKTYAASEQKNFFINAYPFFMTFLAKNLHLEEHFSSFAYANDFVDSNFNAKDLLLEESPWKEEAVNLYHEIMPENIALFYEKTIFSLGAWRKSFDTLSQAQQKQVLQNLSFISVSQALYYLKQIHSDVENLFPKEIENAMKEGILPPNAKYISSLIQVAEERLQNLLNDAESHIQYAHLFYKSAYAPLSDFSLLLNPKNELILREILKKIGDPFDNSSISPMHRIGFLFQKNSPSETFYYFWSLLTVNQKKSLSEKTSAFLEEASLKFLALAIEDWKNDRSQEKYDILHTMMTQLMKNHTRNSLSLMEAFAWYAKDPAVSKMAIQTFLTFIKTTYLNIKKTVGKIEEPFLVYENSISSNPKFLPLISLHICEQLKAFLDHHIQGTSESPTIGDAIESLFKSDSKLPEFQIQSDDIDPILKMEAEQLLNTYFTTKANHNDGYKLALDLSYYYEVIKMVIDKSSNVLFFKIIENSSPEEKKAFCEKRTPLPPLKAKSIIAVFQNNLNRSKLPIDVQEEFPKDEVGGIARYLDVESIAQHLGLKKPIP